MCLQHSSSDLFSSVMRRAVHGMPSVMREMEFIAGLMKARQEVIPEITPMTILNLDLVMWEGNRENKEHRAASVSTRGVTRAIHIVSFNGLQTVEGQNYSFSAASKGYKRYQTMKKSHLKKINKCLCFISTQMLACSAKRVPDFM